MLQNGDSMTFDQKIQLANTIGTWLAAIGTISAVITSLYFARTSNRINLRVLACSGQLILATVLEFNQNNRSDSLGVSPPLY